VIQSPLGLTIQYRLPNMPGSMSIVPATTPTAVVRDLPFVVHMQTANCSQCSLCNVICCIRYFPRTHFPSQTAFRSHKDFSLSSSQAANIKGREKSCASCVCWRLSLTVLLRNAECGREYFRKLRGM
jgi:hypothetical protein